MILVALYKLDLIMISKFDLYFESLLDILRNTDGMNPSQKNFIWISKYRLYESKILSSDIDFLPEIMTLIHPVFLFDAEGNFFGDLIQYNNSSFNNGINESDLCQFNLLHDQSICQFNAFRSIRGKVQADHFWPHSLGGPSIFDNRLLLCKYHNVAKSNSIVNEFWNSYPNWLNSYLQRILNQKN